MVFARNQAAASFLSKAWRERDQVSKYYLAVVHTWHPYHDDNINDGIINLPLSPSDERLKWKIDADGKPSTTEWKIFKVLDQETKSNTTATKPPVILELKPVTGRTHQLRVHCAHVGSGIEGDSLYGTNRVNFDPNGDGKLKLHAWKLIFPHPNGTEVCEFSCDPTWIKPSGEP
jgi:23S rRNA-/tRNA-specific pseudouridylate synthase